MRFTGPSEAGKGMGTPSPIDRDLLDRSHEVGWQAAVDQRYGKGTAWRWSVEDCHYAGPVLSVTGGNEAVLVSACGNGSLPISLSSVVREVLISGTSEEIAFTALRANSLGIDNITPYDGPNGPVPTLAIVDGRRSGMKDLGNISRACVLGKRGVAGQLQTMGYRLGRRDVPYPTPSDSRFLVDDDSRRGWTWIANMVRPRVGVLAPALSLYSRWMLYGWQVGCRSAESCMIDKLSANLLGVSARDIQRSVAHTNRGTLTIPIHVKDGEKPAIVARIDSGRTLVKHEATVIRSIASAGGDFLRTCLPGLLSIENYGLRTLAFYDAVHGTEGSSDLRAYELEWLTRFLTELYELGSRIPQVRNGSDPFDTSELEGHLDQKAGKEYVRCRQELVEGGLRLSTIHGDIHPGNFLDAPDKRTVIDWEYARTGWIAFDWCHYLAVTLTEGRKSLSPSLVAEVLKDARSGHHLLVEKATAEFLVKIGVSPTLWQSFLHLGFAEFLLRRHGTDTVSDFGAA